MEKHHTGVTCSDQGKFCSADRPHRVPDIPSGKCLNWNESKSYVENLTTGGYTDWRVPLVREYGEIYDNTESNVMAMDHDLEHPFALSDLFADGAAYWYWS